MFPLHRSLEANVRWDWLETESGVVTLAAESEADVLAW